MLLGLSLVTLLKNQKQKHIKTPAGQTSRIHHLPGVGGTCCVTSFCTITFTTNTYQFFLSMYIHKCMQKYISCYGSCDHSGVVQYQHSGLAALFSGHPDTLCSNITVRRRHYCEVAMDSVTFVHKLTSLIVLERSQQTTQATLRPPPVFPPTPQVNWPDSTHPTAKWASPSLSPWCFGKSLPVAVTAPVFPKPALKDMGKCISLAKIKSPVYPSPALPMFNKGAPTAPLDPLLPVKEAVVPLPSFGTTKGVSCPQSKWADLLDCLEIEDEEFIPPEPRGPPGADDGDCNALPFPQCMLPSPHPQITGEGCPEIEDEEFIPPEPLGPPEADDGDCNALPSPQCILPSPQPQITVEPREPTEADGGDWNARASAGERACFAGPASCALPPGWSTCKQCWKSAPSPCVCHAQPPAACPVQSPQPLPVLSKFCDQACFAGPASCALPPGWSTCKQCWKSAPSPCVCHAQPLAACPVQSPQLLPVLCKFCDQAVVDDTACLCHCPDSVSVCPGCADVLLQASRLPPLAHLFWSEGVGGVSNVERTPSPSRI